MDGEDADTVGPFARNRVGQGDSHGHQPGRLKALQRCQGYGDKVFLTTVSDLPVTAARLRRADARHNAEAILDAAARVLSERPDAGLAEVARAAGISRQTLYAHYPSRDVLISALIDRATVRVTTALEAAQLDEIPADQALVRLMEVGWASFDADPFLLHLSTPPVSAERDRDRHASILERLQDIVLRGQREGDIDPDLAVNWVLAAILALGHAAGEEVRAGRMTSAQAVEMLQISIPRLLRPDSPRQPTPRR